MHRDSKRTGAPQDRFVRDSDPFHKIFPVCFAKRCPVLCRIALPIHLQPSGSKTPTEEIRLNRGTVLLDDEKNKADTGGVPSRKGPSRNRKQVSPSKVVAYEEAGGKPVAAAAPAEARQ